MISILSPNPMDMTRKKQKKRKKGRHQEENIELSLENFSKIKNPKHRKEIQRKRQQVTGVEIS